MTLTRTEVIRRHLEKLSPAKRANLALLATPRLVHPYIKHIPHPTQQVFLSLNHKREVMFGGAAGGGKSDALLMAALQYVDVPGYAALLLRKTWPDLVLPGAIMDRTQQWLSDTPAQKRDGGRVWMFPSGARIQFGYLQHDQDKFRYQSAEFHFIGFDELTQWREEATYDYLFSRLRRPSLYCLNCNKTLTRYRTGVNVRYQHAKKLTNCTGAFPDPKTMEQYPAAPDGTTIFDVPLRMRSATNPGGVGNEWVKSRFIDPKTRRDNSVFVPSKLSDNPSVDEEVYGESLSYLNEVDRMRLQDGDWDVTEAGEFFYRADFEFIDAIPGNVTDWAVRYWDMAASESKTADYTVGTLGAMTDNGYFVVCDVVRLQRHPHMTEKTLFATAAADGLNVKIRSEMEPGSAGLTVVDHYRRNVFPGFNYDGVRATGSKSARAQAFASYARGKKVLVVKARWNRDWLNELEQFPNGAHDDQVDSAAGCFNELMFGRRSSLIA